MIKICKVPVPVDEYTRIRDTIAKVGFIKEKSIHNPIRICYNYQ